MTKYWYGDYNLGSYEIIFDYISLGATFKISINIIEVLQTSYRLDLLINGLINYQNAVYKMILEKLRNKLAITCISI